jgi:hypothetical protein
MTKQTINIHTIYIYDYHHIFMIVNTPNSTSFTTFRLAKFLITTTQEALLIKKLQYFRIFICIYFSNKIKTTLGVCQISSYFFISIFPCFLKKRCVGQRNEPKRFYRELLVVRWCKNITVS